MDGFPVRLVENYQSQNGVWSSRRTAGEKIANGCLCLFDDDQISPRISLEDVNNCDALVTSKLCEHGICFLFERFAGISELKDTSLKNLFQSLSFVFLCGNDRMVGVGDKSLYINCDIAPQLDIEFDENKCELICDRFEVLNGIEILFGLGQLYAVLIHSGKTVRESLHVTLSAYTTLSTNEQARLRSILETTIIDSGDVFSLFLDKASKLPPENKDKKVWHDLQITWLMGQDRLDIPYDRRSAREILASDIDLDEKRLRLFEVLRSYDRSIEKNNIRRIAKQVRAERQDLVFGRMSRAFHNQGTLFANAVLLEPSQEMASLASVISKASNGHPSLEPSTEALRLLLSSTDEIALTQLEGACERFEDAVLEVQQGDALSALQPFREQVEDHSDTLRNNQFATIDQQSIATQTIARLKAVQQIRTAAIRTKKRHAAYVIISQRPSPTGSHLLVKINEFDEPYLGKAENLKKLVRLAGDRVYSSPDYRWLEQADHWVEAIPLFIKEQISIEDGQEMTRTVVDIAGMEESFREEMADHWALNIRRVLLNDFVSLARELMIPDAINEIERCKRAASTFDPNEIVSVASLIQALYRDQHELIHLRIEKEDSNPFTAMRQILLGANSPTQFLRDKVVSEEKTWQDAVNDTAAKFALKIDDSEWASVSIETDVPHRELPTLHVLTTQSAGMTEGYIRTWLEESMALFNIISASNLHDKVKARQTEYKRRILNLGHQIVNQLGIWVEVEEMAAREHIEEDAALLRVINGNRRVQQELAVLGTLAIHLKTEPDPKLELPIVAKLLNENVDQFKKKSLEEVVERNGEELKKSIREHLQINTHASEAEALLSVVESDPDYAKDLDTYMRFEARQAALNMLDRQSPSLFLRQQADEFLRRYGRLSKTTARKEIISELGLNSQALNPLLYFQATGGNKRYHLIYTPSRVDLGHRERESVETWSQWVGGADRSAAQVGRRIYGLINKSVQSYENLTQPELLKTGENASMSSHFAFSNALSLMTTAAGHGDIEEMGDQMSRRKDRLIHPAGEGYGGYCVPKDGLFLEFVLTLQRGEKLRQIGLSDDQHSDAVKWANEALEKRKDFSTEFEWEQWCRNILEKNPKGPSTIFQPTRIAQVLDGLGKPELNNPYRVMTGMIAEWGIHKMVAGAEHVNRFMPFFKTWLLRQSIVESSLRNTKHQPQIKKFVVVLSAEYKPDTQDGRFSAGMRKFEILAGTGNHLHYSLDKEGQALAALISEGFESLSANGKSEIIQELLGQDIGNLDPEKLSSIFPTQEAPAEIRMVSPTGLSTQDLLTYTSDTELETLANKAQNVLLHAGFSETEIEANMHVHGIDLFRWNHRNRINSQKKESICSSLGGAIHALHLSIVGPDYDYEHALQGSDVLDVGIPHQELLKLLQDPGRLCDLMLEGRPTSALSIVDGASGARRRAMNRFDVMLFFAAAEQRGREGVYSSIGLGQQTIEAWRQTMRRHRRRADLLGTAICNEYITEADKIFDEIRNEIIHEQEVELCLDETAKLQRFGRDRPRDRQIAQLLSNISSGMTLAQLEFDFFLALGGLFLLNGKTKTDILKYRQQFEDTIANLSNKQTPDATRPLNDFLYSQLVPQIEEFREEKGIESSNKAAEESPKIAIEARRQLAERVSQAQALNERQRAFDEISHSATTFETAFEAAKTAVDSSRIQAPLSERAFGYFCAHARNALIAIGNEYSDEAHPDEAQQFLERLSALFSGRQIDIDVWKSISGGYEDIGDLGRIAQRIVERANQQQISLAERDEHLERVAKAGQLLYGLFAIESTIGPTHQSTEERDIETLWRNLAEFFAETVNDHFYEYRPWLYDRGIGYDHYRGQDLYKLAVDHHAWLYTYLRHVICNFTDVADLSPDEQDILLGNTLSSSPSQAIGAEADNLTEQQWRCYGQLREISFIRNDGFSIPPIFAEFDPDLISSSTRVNHVFATPVGRTHYSRALSEGPTLSRELENRGEIGANLIISRSLKIKEGQPPVAYVESGHFYIDAETYIEALQAHKGLSKKDAVSIAANVSKKGLRIAAIFNRPILAALVFPFHGDPLYHSGRLEDCGFPYTIQSLFHTWTTYDKAKYPDIFPSESLVELPAEIDWLAEYGNGISEDIVKNWISEGTPDGRYTGLIHFSHQHRVVIAKDAGGSGGRGMRVFILRLIDGSIDPIALNEAIDFIYQLSLKGNVSIQEVVISSPEYWATESFIREFIGRQIIDWGSSVERDRRPRTRIYGSHRIILSTDKPNAQDPKERWNISHWITLNSKQLITNVGRGGNLDLFEEKIVQDQHKKVIFERLADAGRNVMNALSAYEKRAGNDYKHQTGRNVGSDLTGLSYGIPRYMMLDFLIAPIFDQPGELVDIQPDFDATGQRKGSHYILRHKEDTFRAQICDWRIVLVEPNIGLGLWDRVAIREEIMEQEQSTKNRTPFNSDAVGQQARLVLADLTRAGADYLNALGQTEISE
ncbi:MAG: hypothetical protein VX294_05590 [Candidatus Latescibacterota bacterium]|nr:hypothetical protein [Candidatus Latescibacterota bacterium]